jgi:hypothetical protein
MFLILTLDSDKVSASCSNYEIMARKLKIYKGILESMSDNVCSAIDSLKKECYLKMAQ